MKVKTSIVLDARLKAKAVAKAKVRGQTFSGLVGVLLSEYVQSVANPAPIRQSINR